MAARNWRWFHGGVDECGTELSGGAEVCPFPLPLAQAAIDITVLVLADQQLICRGNGPYGEEDGRKAAG